VRALRWNFLGALGWWHVLCSSLSLSTIWSVFCAAEWSGECIPCDKTSAGWVLVFVGGIWVVAIMLFRASQATSGQTKIFFYVSLQSV